MGEQMLVTQALDERDLVCKKIYQKITSTAWADWRKENEENTATERVSREVFKASVESAYQQISDLISRYQKIDAAIILSNSQTEITTSFGKMTVASALALRRRIHKKTAAGGRLTFGEGFESIPAEDNDFESMLAKAMENKLESVIRIVEGNNQKLAATADSMRLSVLGNESRTKENAEAMEVIKTYMKQNTAQVEDPINIRKKVEMLREKHEVLLSEIETQLKISNAITMITIE